jgi:hypothetical protein
MADVLVERNNHGQAVLEALSQRDQLRLLSGHDENRLWLVPFHLTSAFSRARPK